MSDQSEFYQQIAAFQKQERDETGEKNARTIADLSAEYPYFCQHFQNSIRICGIKNDVLVDVFPKSQKFHNIRTNERGLFDDLEEFIHSLFKDL